MDLSIQFPELSDQLLCESAILCALPDGSLIKVATEVSQLFTIFLTPKKEECTSLMSCHLKCNGTECTNQEACEATGKSSSLHEPGSSNFQIRLLH